jgi:hypothetical protein
MPGMDIAFRLRPGQVHLSHGDPITLCVVSNNASGNQCLVLSDSVFSTVFGVVKYADFQDLLDAAPTNYQPQGAPRPAIGPYHGHMDRVPGGRGGPRVGSTRVPVLASAQIIGNWHGFARPGDEMEIQVTW